MNFKNRCMLNDIIKVDFVINVENKFIVNENYFKDSDIKYV